MDPGMISIVSIPTPFPQNWLLYPGFFDLKKKKDLGSYKLVSSIGILQGLKKRSLLPSANTLYWPVDGLEGSTVLKEKKKGGVDVAPGCGFVLSS